ncbi:DUF6128 domain-containing protein [Candidatus Galacturonibacter soehngenii]|uniref:DUF6128 domain-containing protein n=1 Tax=Candidatus Galacturonatibacter soehngenii TaxID=2307010 RepID=A0A7V7UFD9_9FIRM|nr:DUF6128 domain-containing protein [Candidatus Galacturonibacter soehngenii]KAB1436575.1 hypothetical protein F7O84_14540 [Candidatus Galacturonibacter soehngenii]
MSEYQRFVSYIYLYDRGIKVKNSGFAKIECKDNILRIKMNLKGVFNNIYEKWTVYLLVEENQEMLGIYTGDLKGKGNSAEFQVVCSAENLNKTTKSFQDVKGLAVISSGNKKYATFWKETNITIESFREYTEEKDKNQKRILNFRTEKKQENKYLEAMSVEKEAKEKEEKSVKKSEETKVPEKKLEKVLTTEVVDMVEKPEENHSQSNLTIEEAQKISEFEPEPKIELEVNLNENWNKLIQQYKSLNPFSDQDIECIRIELKDLKILPKSQWGLSSNSFVLHGFYNYQYLILGRIKERFIIGVPGIYCNKEKLVAGLFGFNDFRPAQVSEYKTGRFGYWYKYL